VSPTCSGVIYFDIGDSLSFSFPFLPPLSSMEVPYSYLLGLGLGYCACGGHGALLFPWGIYNTRRAVPFSSPL
jgi:hypothetical protein